MAKSKIVRANAQIADKVVHTFGMIENSVVGGYTKIEDAFVDCYLSRPGESVAEAKQRLKQEKTAAE